ncbi:hypothetical protein [Pectobacterium phage Wc4-1]|uniref:Uncharacterized protein n=1 Tax=Pectobacterium phage Wc4 TaxID=2652428 RepID=A0A5P8D550_9CAUD|nr:hypothetical protein [Pectobacterium phage Wc4]QFP93916.1 hypothetical protein [Pectobacterium phage Wc4-1]
MLVYAIQYSDDDALDLKAVALNQVDAQNRFKQLAGNYGYSLKTATRYISIEIWDGVTGEYIRDLKPITE